MEEAKWEEEQRNKALEEERKNLPQPAAAAASPANKRAYNSSGFQGFAPVVPKPASANTTPVKTAKTNDIASKLKALREAEEARKKANEDTKQGTASVFLFRFSIDVLFCS